MKKPQPALGLVIRYDYLWRDEVMRGHLEGVKERPCAIVVARQTVNGKQPQVLLVPITHSPPKNPNGAVEIPPKVKQHLGLDQERSWIIVNELNSVAWDDAGIVPVSRTHWEYGFLPGKLAQILIDRIIEQQQCGKLKITDRVQIEKQQSRDV